LPINSVTSFAIFIISSPSQKLAAADCTFFPTVAHLSYPPPFLVSYDIIKYNTSMISGRRIGCEVAVLAVLSVLAIFLFPGVQGPYSVVHGPVSALQAARAAVRLRIAIVQSALSSLANAVFSAVVIISWMSVSNPKFQPIGLSEYSSILRC